MVETDIEPRTSAPAGFKAKKRPKSKLRKEQTTPAESTPGEPGAESSAAALAKKKKKKKKTASMLSFGDDEEHTGAVEEFKSRKGKSKGYEPKRKGGSSDASAALHNTQVSRGGEYSAERLAELRKNARSLPSGTGAARQPRQSRGPPPPACAEPGPEAEAGPAAADGGGEATDLDSIPSSHEIHLARRQRERARERGEFISLEEQAEHDRYVPQGPRLARSDSAAEDILNGMDESDRLSFADAARQTNRQSARVAAEVALRGRLDEGDAEFARWENQQIRTGSTAATVAKSRPDSDTTGPGSRRRSLPPNGGARNVQQPEQVVEELYQKLKTSHISMNEVYRSHATHLDRLTSDLEVCNATLPELKADLEEASDRYSFIMELKGYIGDMLECLDEKMPIIHGCEAKIHTLWKARADALVERDRRDYEDSVTVLAKDSPLDRDHERRISNKRARFKRRGPDAADDFTDDEFSSEDAERWSERETEVMSEAGEIFTDVNVHFCEIERIATKFETWKRQFGESYRATYAGDSLRKILTPLVKLEALRWNPTAADASPLDGMQWLQQLMEYGLEDGVDMDETDPDLQLVPDLVELAILPKVAGIAEFVWDPSSTRQAQMLRELVRELNEYPSVSPDRKATQELFSAIAARLGRVVADWASRTPLALGTGQKKDLYTESARSRATELKVLEAVISWRGLLAESVICDLATQHLAGRIAVTVQRLGLGMESLSHLEAAATYFPPEWFQGQSPAQLAAQLAAIPFIDTIRKVKIAIAGAVSFVVLRSPKRQLMKDGLPMQGVFQAFAASATQRCATVAAIFGENLG